MIEADRMDSCTEQMLEMEQPDEVYPVGRALRHAFTPPPEGDADDQRSLLARIDGAEDATASGAAPSSGELQPAAPAAQP